MLAQMSPTTALIFLNFANILYLVCYAVRDVLWLRLFCVTAMCAIMPYYVWGEETPLMFCIWWNVIFMAINIFWIVVIIRQRQPPKMTYKQKQLFAEVFEPSCSPREMLTLLAVSERVEFQIGELVVNRSSNPNGLMLIEQGQANVTIERDGAVLATLGRGDFIGEMSFLTGEPAVADVAACTPLKIIRWEKKQLENLFESRHDLKSVINEIIGRDLVHKIVSNDVQLPELSVDTVIQ